MFLQRILRFLVTSFETTCYFIFEKFQFPFSLNIFHLFFFTLPFLGLRNWLRCILLHLRKRLYNSGNYYTSRHCLAASEKFIAIIPGLNLVSTPISYQNVQLIFLDGAVIGLVKDHCVDVKLSDFCEETFFEERSYSKRDQVSLFCAATVVVGCYHRTWPGTAEICPH